MMRFTLSGHFMTMRPRPPGRVREGHSGYLAGFTLEFAMRTKDTVPYCE